MRAAETPGSMQISSVCFLTFADVGSLICVMFTEVPQYFIFFFSFYFFFFFCYDWMHQTHDCTRPHRNFFRRLTTNKPQGGKKKRKKKTDKQRKKEGENSSVVHPVDDILCSPSVISFSSVKMDRISSCVSLPLRDDCSTDVPGDTFFFFFLFPSVSLVLSVAAIFSELYELVTTLFFFLFPFLSFPHLLSRFLISAQAQIQHLPPDRVSISLSISLSNPGTHTHTHQNTR